MDYGNIGKENIGEIFEDIQIHFKNIFKEKLEERSEINIDKSSCDIKEIVKFIFKNLKEEVDINFYLHSKGFSDFTKKYPFRSEDFLKIYVESVYQKREEFLSNPLLKKMLSETLSELPNSLARVYQINLGLETKADGTELTLKEYSMLCNDDHNTNLQLLESAKRLLNQKIKRKVGRIKL